MTWADRQARIAELRERERDALEALRLAKSQEDHARRMLEDACALLTEMGVEDVDVPNV